MPDQNQTDPNSPQSPVVPTVDPSVIIPPVVPAPDSTFQIPDSSDVAPMPDFMNQSQSNDVASPAVVPAGTEEGSAAPVNFPSMVSAPKKKFGGGKIIATILGILVLVGGVGTGVYLTQQQQILAPKAIEAGNCQCASDTTGNNVGGCYCTGSTGHCPSGTHMKNDRCGESGRGGGGGGGACAAGSASVCIGKNAGDVVDACWSNNGNGNPGDDHSLVCHGSGNNPVCSAVDDLTPGSCDTVSGGGGGGTVTNPVCVFDHWTQHNVCVQVGGQWKRCANANPTGEMGYQSGCSQDNQCTNNSYPNCGTGGYCLAIAPPFCTPTTLPDNAGCVNDNTCGPNDNPTPTPIPTVPPIITAQCQNIKAYNPSWAALTSAQLSALAPATVVNFCVVGSATGGSFDKAKFTINGVAQAETTTQRPSTQDYCQNYTIPAATTTFNVTAQIHHVTLGWK